LSLAEIANYGWSFASLTLLRKVKEGPQLVVVFVVVVAAAALEEEHMAYLDQQYYGKEGQAVVVVEDFPISDLDDSSNLDCICCLKDHNYSVVVGFVVEDDVSSIGACRPRIFFINGFLCFLEDEWQWNGEGRETGDATSRRR